MIDSDISKQYALCAADSCDKVGLPWEYFKGYREKDDIWNLHPVKSKSKFKINGKGGAATASHVHIWHKIAQDNQAAVILEHDAIMLHKPEIDIPDDQIVALGYKVEDPENYNYVKAGAPSSIQERKHHGGAHAYAITPATAKTLVSHIETHGLTNMIDNHYFLRIGSSRKKIDVISLGITDPICALGWLRESTIWNKSAVDNYRPLLPSFEQNYNSKRNLGLKG